MAVELDEDAVLAAMGFRDRAEAMRLAVDTEAGRKNPAFDLSVASTLLNNGFGEADLLRVLGYVPDGVKDRI